MKIELFTHSNRLYNPQKPPNSYQESFHEMVKIVKSNPEIMSLILNKSSWIIAQS